MFKCPLTGELCLCPKNIPVLGMLNGKPTQTMLCKTCASYLDTSIKWQMFLKTVFHHLRIDKVLPPEELEYAIANIQDVEELNVFIEMLAEKKKRVEQLPPCPSCGLDLHKLLESGMFGCDHCYSHFSDLTSLILSKAQPANKHEGKVPAHLAIASLKEEMAKAIKEERYEDAAKLRDKIKQINEWKK